MKYIVTEQQLKTAEKSIRDSKIKESIYKFFNGHLTPYGGWDSHDTYASELEENGGELFLPIKDIDDWDFKSDNHMWYSICENGNLSEPIPEGHCPVVTLPTLIFEALDGYFGDMWKTLFKRWFMGHTGLEVIQVDKD